MEQDSELAESLLGDERARREVTDTLLEITSRAAANADGDVGVGLSVVVAGKVQSIGATTDPAQSMDFGQASDGDGPCLHALQIGDMVGVGDYATDQRWPGTSRRAGAAGIRSSLSLPLKAGDDVLGALNVYSNSAHAFSREAALSLEAFAQQATTSLLLLGRLQSQRDSALYVTEFSRTIQESLRTVLPNVPGLALLGASMPSSPHAAVSGDWYDAFVLPDGSLGLVIGDVMGHGIEAVTAMGQIRTMVRAAAYAALDPAAVVHLVDQLAHDGGISETTTLVYANLRRDQTGTWLHYCNAGHPYPLLRDPDGNVREFQDGTRTLLGALGTGPAQGPVQPGVVELPPGSVLLLYTDGLTERRSDDTDEATEAVRAALAGLGHLDGLEVLRDQLLRTPNGNDDTTVFAVRILV